MRELWTDKRIRCSILLPSAAFLLLAHSYRWMNAMFTHDALVIVQKDWRWQVALGRIFNPLYVWFRGRLTAPVNVAVFSSLFLILSIALVVHILRLRKTSSIVLCCGFLTTFETLTFVNGSFLLSLDLDMLALLFSVLGAYFMLEKPTFAACAAGVLSVTLMLGLFQSYIEVTILLICLRLLRDSLEGADAKELFFRGLRSIGLMIAGGLLYYLCLKIAFRYTGVAPATSINGLVRMKDLTVPKILSLSKDAWLFTLKYLFNNSMISHVTISRWAYRALGLFTVAAVVRTAVRNRLGAASCALIAFLMLIMPLGGNCVYVLGTGLKHGLMNYAFAFFSVFAVMAFDMLETDSSAEGAGRGAEILRYGKRYAVPLLCSVLLLNHVLFSNQWYLRSHLISEAGISFMTRLTTRMGEVDGYEPGETRVLILGDIDENPEAYRGRDLDIAVDTGIGSQHHHAVSYYDSYARMFHTVLGYNANMVPFEEVAGYLDDPEIQAMPVYPSQGSIKMIGGILVVRLSEDLRPEDIKWN